MYKMEEKKQIKYIKVFNGRQTFFVKDKKKIKYWLNLSEKTSSISESTKTIIIKKVVYA